MNKTLGQSWAFQEMMEFLHPRQQNALSILKKRIYEKIMPYLIPQVTLYQNRAHLMMSSTGSIKVFHNLTWVDVPLREKGSVQSEEERDAYLHTLMYEEGSYYTNARAVQVSENDTYVIGGSKTFNYLLTRP